MKWKNKFFIGIFDRIFRAFSNWIEMAIIDPKDLSQRIIWIFWTRSTHKCLIWLAKSLNFRRFYVPFSPGFFKNFPRGSGSGLEKNPRGNPGRETPGLTPTKYLSGEQPQIFQKLIRNLREPSRIRSSDKKKCFSQSRTNHKANYQRLNENENSYMRGWLVKRLTPSLFPSLPDDFDDRCNYIHPFFHH